MASGWALSGGRVACTSLVSTLVSATALVLASALLSALVSALAWALMLVLAWAMAASALASALVPLEARCMAVLTPSCCSSEIWCWLGERHAASGFGGESGEPKRRAGLVLREKI